MSAMVPTVQDHHDGPAETPSDEGAKPPCAVATPLSVTLDPATSKTRLPTGMPINPQTRTFRRRHFPHATRTQWNDWRWQLRSRIRDLKGLEEIFSLSDAERRGFEGERDPLPAGITPYSTSLMSEDDTTGPLRLSQVPLENELSAGPGEATDPPGEDDDTVVPGLVHRYPDRVPLLATASCSTHCRYCTRAPMVGESAKDTPGTSLLNRALHVLRFRREVRDVLISGNDLLALRDNEPDRRLNRLRKIPLLPKPLQDRAGDDVLLRSFEGRTYAYPNRLSTPDSSASSTLS